MDFTPQLASILRIVLRRSAILLFVTLLTCPLAAQGLDLEFHGRMDADWNSFFGDTIPTRDGFEDGAEFRRMRFALSGRAIELIDFRAVVDLDVDASEAELNTLWLQVRDLPAVGRVRLGYYKEPFGLERGSRSNALTFMERSSAATLTPNRNFGISFAETLLEERALWSAGVFREVDVSPDRDGRVLRNALHYTGRFTFLPWYEDNGRRLLHLGGSVSRREVHDGITSISEGMQLNQSPTLVDTADIAADGLTLLAFEAATVFGPWSVQGEWLQTVVDLSGAGRAVFPGFYIQASYFLTGESRAYNTKRAQFEWPQVRSMWHFSDGGVGAWEIAARYSKLDLNNGAITGGVLRSSSLGLNCYLTASIKLQLDYESARLEDVGAVHGVAMRFEFNW